MTTRWRVVTVYDSPDTHHTLVRLCDQGWEPFAAVATTGAYYPTVYLRMVVDDDAAQSGE